jgi:hypothetical protein
VRPAPAGHPEWIGIGFAPSRGRRVPDITGALWLDRETAELRRLEFKYVNLPQSAGHATAGGYVRFKRLGTGDWIITHWVIRFPETELRVGVPLTQQYAVVGERISSGVTLRATRAGTVLHRDDGGTLALAIQDADRDNTWRGSAGRLVGTSRWAFADSEPVLRFTFLAEGTYRVEVKTPFMVAAAVPAVVSTVEVSFDSVATARVTLPSVAEMGALKCRDAVFAFGVLQGSDGVAIPEAAIFFRWTETHRALTESWRVSAPTIEERELKYQTDPAGRWAVCLPAGKNIRADVSVGDIEWPPRMLEHRGGRYRIRPPDKLP